MSALQLTLTVRTLEKELFSGQVRSVELPGTMGRFEVLAGHAPLVSRLVKGMVRYRLEASKLSLPIEGGVVEVSDNVVRVLVYSTHAFNKEA